MKRRFVTYLSLSSRVTLSKYSKYTYLLSLDIYQYFLYKSNAFLKSFNFSSMKVSTMFKSIVATVLVFQACLASPIDTKITDGSDAMPGEFPHQVSIQWGLPPFVDYSHTCGGSILDSYHILTAGHCVMPLGSLRVFAGKHDITITEANEQSADVSVAIVHENYKGGIAQHDIAILKLATPLKMNNRVAAVQLPTQNEIRTGNSVLSGWGSISKDIFPILPAVLQKVTVPILDNPTCLKKFPKNIIGEQPKLFETQICTDAIKEESACSGDSGGPLVQYENNKAVQVGIVSWGVYPCGVTHVPSVYTRVASYVDWIHSATEK